MKTWTIGSNAPMQLPVVAFEFSTWREAADHLLILLGNRYDVLVSQHQKGIAMSYVRARQQVMEAKPDFPLSLFYGGEVFWLADLPPVSN